VGSLEDVDSYVQKISNKGDSLIIGGNFTNVGYTQPYLAAFTTSSDKPDRTFPTTNGEVKSVISDGSGGYYVCGTFTQIDGISQPYLAKLNSSKQVVTGYTPVINSYVYTMLIQGTTLYIGGAFTQTNGATRQYISAISTTGSGGNKTWSTTNTNNAVYALASDGTSIFAGGDFTSTSGSTRNRAAKFDLNGNLDGTWDPNMNSTVKALVVSGSSYLCRWRIHHCNAVSRTLPRQA
jgi:hypothetical protein